MFVSLGVLCPPFPSGAHITGRLAGHEVMTEVIQSNVKYFFNCVCKYPKAFYICHRKQVTKNP